MAVRTTATAVQAFLEPGGEYNGTTDLSTFVNEASLIVDRLAACAAARGLSPSSDLLAVIEARLAAHGYLLSDKAYASESEGGASGTYQGKTGMGFDGTYHGQQALRLDWTGCLTAMDKGQTAGLAWLGKRPSEQIPARLRW